MKPVLTLHSSAIIGLAILSAPGPAAAQPSRDPWLPPAARSAPLAEETRGPALQRQVLAKLEGQFRAADASGRGALSLDEARRAGWGFAVRNFEQLDRDGRGEIRIQDLQRFMQAQNSQAR